MSELKVLRRMTKWGIVFFVGITSICASGPAQSQETAARLTATEVMVKSNKAFYYAGADMKTEVTMELETRDGKKRTRVLTMLRMNDPKSTAQKYYIYFHEPADVRRMTFLVWKYPEKEDDRWIYVPAVDLVRRIASSDARSSFVGSDFTYEDVSGRDLDADTHTLLREEKLGEKDCYVVESVPKETIDYVKRISWIDKATFLSLKEEYYDLQNELARLFTADDVKEVPAGESSGGPTVPMVIRRTMKNVKSGHLTQVTFTSVSYNVGLDDDIFTERYLRRAPSKWIK